MSRSLSKRVRFEVFKRDLFTCQYCGAKAPDVVLQCDHINPVANGGDSGIMNLVTACFDCNSGKGARKLDDRSEIERQRTQIEDMQARREQLEMMLKWRDTEQASALDAVEEIGRRMAERGGFAPSLSGKQDIRRWLKRLSVSEVLEALDEAFDAYMQFNGDEPIEASWELAFKKIPAIANLRRQAADRPWIVRLAYVQGILRRRLIDPRGNYISALEQYFVEWQVPAAVLEDHAKACASWDDFGDRVVSWCAARTPPPPVAPMYAVEPDLEKQIEQDDGYDDDGYD